MPVPNLLVAGVLDEIADRLEIQGANPFRVRAYRSAARTVQQLATDVRQMAERGETLEGRPGIGADLAGKIAEIATTGSCGVLRDLRQQMPPAITELLKVPGLGPKRVHALWQDLGLATVDQVLRAAREGRIHEHPGFGAKTEQHIAQVLDAQRSKAVRFTLAVAAEYATELVRHLEAAPGTGKVAVAGSFRRMRDTVGDLDIVVTANDGAAVTDRFVHHHDVAEILSQGSTRASVRLRGGLQVDLRVVPRESFGGALAYFTGSKAHNIALRRLGQSLGLKINEYGVFRGDERIAGETEASVYRAVGLPFIPPELREDRGELDAARDGRLPRLVARDDLQGDLHVHTNATDGRDTLEAMAEAARTQGLRYVAITDHSQRQAMAHGLDAAALARQGTAIARLNGALHGFRVLRGLEVDILDDGRLDMPDEALAALDVVVAAVHSRFTLDRARQTERILRALDHPSVTILAHPTGRLLGEREPYDVDLLQVVRKAKARGVCLEVNAQPDRLDLDDAGCRMCRDEGAMVAIGSDAHSTRDFGNLPFGVGQARRGWLERAHVLNAKPLAGLEAWLKRSRTGLPARSHLTRPARAASPG
ncbi:MAG TPA: DNA polymerase/3'-5' exonuclease PolX [Casimicrobiaceae bacterium]|nr:DNA polymerase/3'-5' exonuclease PolX [Casimicrobiaceae bacterium]